MEGKVFLKNMPRVSVVSEGIQFKEHNGPECVNFLTPWLKNSDLCSGVQYRCDFMNIGTIKTIVKLNSGMSLTGVTFGSRDNGNFNWMLKWINPRKKTIDNLPVGV